MSIFKRNKAKRGKKLNRKAPIFIVENDGVAYYKDRRLNLVCKKAKLVKNSPYEGYMWMYNYSDNIEWFKRYLILILVNHGNVRFVGTTKEEFLNPGEGGIESVNTEQIDIEGLSAEGLIEEVKD